jgi:glycosyltransferase involved in cell wall biosynthesis
MPAYNVGKYVRDAIDSVLRQEGVDLELIVVDDGSTDDTRLAIERVQDPRLRVLHNERNRGIAYSHNRILGESSAPFIAHVDADDMLRHGALRKMVDAVRASPRIGQAYCHHLAVDAQGRTSLAAFRGWHAFMYEHRPVGVDYRRGLLVHGMVVNHLRTYRREVLDAVGWFDERLRYAEDYEMAVRIADKYDIVLVPDFLYFFRQHPESTTQRLALREVRYWVTRARICNRLLWKRGGKLLGRNAAAVYACMGLGLAYVVREALSGSRDRTAYIPD